MPYAQETNKLEGKSDLHVCCAVGRLQEHI